MTPVVARIHSRICAEGESDPAGGRASKGRQLCHHAGSFTLVDIARPAIRGMLGIIMTWYSKGLHFECQRSGRCCTGEPGRVWLSDEEVSGLASALGIDDDAFRRRYTVTVHRRGVSLVEKPNNDCIFYRRGHGCQVYEQRPRQCRTWPFWRSNLRSEADWTEAASACPGMNKGPLVTVAEIDSCSENDGLPR